MPYVIRTQRLPIVDVEMFGEFPATDQRAMYDEYLELSAKHPQMGFVIDTRKLDASLTHARGRRESALVFGEYAGRLVPVSVCEARVVKSEFMRGVVTAFDWLTGTKWPCATFTSPDAADTWVQARLTRALARLPASTPERHPPP